MSMFDAYYIFFFSKPVTFWIHVTISNTPSKFDSLELIRSFPKLYKTRFIIVGMTVATCIVMSIIDVSHYKCLLFHCVVCPNRSASHALIIHIMLSALKWVQHATCICRYVPKTCYTRACYLNVSSTQSHASPTEVHNSLPWHWRINQSRPSCLVLVHIIFMYGRAVRTVVYSADSTKVIADNPLYINNTAKLLQINFSCYINITKLISISTRVYVCKYVL